MMVDTNIILTCSTKYPNSSFIDVDTNVNIQWLNSSNHILHSYTGPNDYTEHTLNYTISSVKLSDAGEYYCSLFINTTMAHIISSDTMTASTNVELVSKCLKFTFLFYNNNIIIIYSTK